MTAINSNIHEVPGVRLPLQTSYASPSHAVFMYSTSSEGVTLQLRDTDDLDDKSGLASVLARLQQDDATLSISYQDTEMLTEGSIDVLLGTGSLHSTGTNGTATFDLFDSETVQDLTLSPPTFATSTEAFLNDNSDSLGAPGDTDTVGSSEDVKNAPDSSKLSVKKPRPKAASPNRQGPQQCQVCGKIFGNASALAKHKLTHSDERKYVCSMCGKAFKRQDHLNGHMLTHRNKKPYECKAEGCGKSYCDARSLRRHTENHHTASNASSTTTNREVSSPLASGCIQYAPPPAQPSQSYPASSSPASSTTSTPSRAPSQLQQLLASDSAPTPSCSTSSGRSSSGGNNDGLTRQQLDLIHQIIQHTQSSSQKQQQRASSSNGTASCSSGTSRSSTVTKAKAWTVQLDVTRFGPRTRERAMDAWIALDSYQGSSCVADSSAATQKEVSSSEPEDDQPSSTTASEEEKPGDFDLCGRNPGRCFAGTDPSNGYRNPDSSGNVDEDVFLKPQDTRIVTSRFEWSPAVGEAKPSVSSAQNGHATVVGKTEPKPVECNLCHRKFKNIPALNGHMRLHGGYFKKDSDSRRCERREMTGPPLQTASMSVRALIEEKIIQKRITNPQNGVTISGEANGVRTLSAQLSNASGNPESDLNFKLSSFVVPAPPLQASVSSSEKIRRHSDSEHFFPPRAPPGMQQEAKALAELLLKRGKKLSVKRASSDPGGRADPSSPLQLSASSSPGQPLQLSFQSTDYSLGGVTYQSDDGGYFSPNIQEDVFQQVSADSMLLQGVDPNQLAESLQFQAWLLQDQSDQMALEEYQSSNNQDLQAVLNSPLPVSLADFGGYGGSQTQSPKDLQYHQDSPLQQNKDFVNYVNSPHPSLATQSPLPSPITQHDSPSFTYPTPPASQEGHSPSFSQSLLTNSLRISSPQQAGDGFAQSVISHSGAPVPASSPLSAAFYPSTMSGAAAVEAALSEVLPLDSQNNCNSSARLSMYQPSPPPPSPLSSTPVPSPLSLSSVPASSSSVSSPLPQTAFNTSQSHTNFPLSPQQPLQSQMMPNSEDPLLSSSPKDFASRKRFDFNGIHSFKLIGNGMVDLGNGGLGIMVDSNGELKIFQAATPHQAKNLVMSGAAIINARGGSFVRKVEPGTSIRISGRNSSGCQNFTTSSNAVKNQRPKLQIALENIKEEVEDDVFLSPSSIPASPSRIIKKKPQHSESVSSNTVHHPAYQSRLRAPRAKDCGTPPPYTPAPILNPSRLGQGLYWHMAANVSSLWPTSTTIHTTSNGVHDKNDFTEVPPESDETPRINIGSRYQATIPELEIDRIKLDREPSYEHLLWDPGIGKLCTDAEIEMYLEFACCAAVPGGGRNKEYALHLLNMCHGNIHEAMLKLMQPTPWLPPGHPLLAYEYAESDRWSADEVDAFHQGLLKFDKDFRTIAHEIGSKTVKQCIQFYYLWKKICPEEYKRLRLLRRRKECDVLIKTEVDLGYEEIKIEPDIRFPSPVNDSDLVSTSSESRLFVCEYTDCSASFNSRAALSGHIRIHGGTLGNRAPTPDRRGISLGDALEEFPCKICGKIFNKVKSRSAHMKSHRPPDAEPKKPKLESHKIDLGDQIVGRTISVSSSSISVSRLT